MLLSSRFLVLYSLPKCSKIYFVQICRSFEQESYHPHAQRINEQFRCFCVLSSSHRNKSRCKSPSHIICLVRTRLIKRIQGSKFSKGKYVFRLRKVHYSISFKTFPTKYKNYPTNPQLKACKFNGNANCESLVMIVHKFMSSKSTMKSKDIHFCCMRQSIYGAP